MQTSLKVVLGNGVTLELNPKEAKELFSALQKYLGKEATPLIVVQPWIPVQPWPYTITC